MKYFLFIPVLLSYFATMDVYALNPNSDKKVSTCRTVNDCDDVEEKLVYQIIYNDMNNILLEKETSLLNFYGIDASYFIDDIKNYAKCFSDAFATEITIEEVNVINTKYASTPTRDAIFKNINNKYMGQCRQKYIPYIDNAGNIVIEYVSRACGSLEKGNSFDDCTDKLGLDMVERREQTHKFCNKDDDFKKCYDKYLSNIPDKK